MIAGSILDFGALKNFPKTMHQNVLSIDCNVMTPPAPRSHIRRNKKQNLSTVEPRPSNRRREWTQGRQKSRDGGAHASLEENIDRVHVFNFRVSNGIHRREPVAVEHQGNGLLRRDAAILFEDRGKVAEFSFLRTMLASRLQS